VKVKYVRNQLRSLHLIIYLAIYPASSMGTTAEAAAGNVAAPGDQGGVVDISITGVTLAAALILIQALVSFR
jgi:hypothetical protein